MTNLEDEFERQLRELDDAGLLRALPGPPEGVDLVSSDFLGLSRHPEVIEAFTATTRAEGAGATSARLLSGARPAHRAAEQAVADWLGAEDALLFPTGYQANLGVLSVLAGPGDVILSDALAHASLIDGARLSRARIAVFDHDDVAHVERLLADAAGARRRIVVTEGVFSMDGDGASLVELAAVCAAHDAALVVDEAHATGVVGPSGAGAWAAALADGADPSVLAARVVTGGKALGLAGAFVVGSANLRQLLLNRARSFVYTTAPPPGLAGALVASIELARRADGVREHVRGLARRLADGLGLSEPAAAIVPVPVGPAAQTLELAATLREEGFAVRAVRPPTVPEGTSRLRLTLHPDNTEAQVEKLVTILGPREAPPAESPPAGPRPLVVVGTDTDVGKTVVSALLVRAAGRVGEVAYWKPVQTGDDSDTATVRRLAEGTAVRFHEPTFWFPLPASPHEAAADAGGLVDVDALTATWEAHAREGAGWLIVEPAGGWHVPLTDDVLTSDWLAARRPELVLVARSGLGTLNHTRLTLEALRARALEPRALFLVGEPHASNRRTLADATGLTVHELPVLDPLDADALDAWLDTHDLGSLFR